MKNRILIADDHPILRAGIREIIGSIKDAELVAEAVDGLDAYRKIISLIPDIAILDLEMPHLTGLEVCKKVMSEKHYTRFIILTMHKDKRFFEDAMASGVLGYLLKDTAIDDLVRCISSVAVGSQYVSPMIHSYLTSHQARQMMPPDVMAMYTTLTPTEKVILKLVAQSKTSSEIADSIFISPNTVDNHRTNIARKLKLEGKNSLMKFALQYKELL